MSEHETGPDGEGIGGGSNVVQLQPKEEISNPITSPAHYTGRGGIEPIDFIVSNGFDYLEGNVIKYVTRYLAKNGVEDLHKAAQYLAWLIQRETPHG